MFNQEREAEYAGVITKLSDMRYTADSAHEEKLIKIAHDLVDEAMAYAVENERKANEANNKSD